MLCGGASTLVSLSRKPGQDTSIWDLWEESDVTTLLPLSLVMIWNQQSYRDTTLSSPMFKMELQRQHHKGSTPRSNWSVGYRTMDQVGRRMDLVV